MHSGVLQNKAHRRDLFWPDENFTEARILFFSSLLPSQCTHISASELFSAKKRIGSFQFSPPLPFHHLPSLFISSPFMRFPPFVFVLACFIFSSKPSFSFFGLWNLTEYMSIGFRSAQTDRGGPLSQVRIDCSTARHVLPFLSALHFCSRTILPLFLMRFPSPWKKKEQS